MKNQDQRAALVARLHEGIRVFGPVTGPVPRDYRDALAQIESDGRKLARVAQAAHEVDCGTSEALQESLVNAIDAILEGGDDE